MKSLCEDSGKSCTTSYTLVSLSAAEKVICKRQNGVLDEIISLQKKLLGLGKVSLMDEALYKFTDKILYITYNNLGPD